MFTNPVKYLLKSCGSGTKCSERVQNIIASSDLAVTLSRPEEILRHARKQVPDVYSMGPKCLELKKSPEEEHHLNAKLGNMTELLAMERVRMFGSMSKAIWRQELELAEVTDKVGPSWDIYGHSIQGKVYLYPEEALFLMDVGGLELTYNGVSLSLQRAYILLLNRSFSMDKYRVYSQLSLLGYNVQRHSKMNILTKYEKDIEIHKIGVKKKSSASERLNEKFETAPRVVGDEFEVEGGPRIREDKDRVATAYESLVLDKEVEPIAVKDWSGGSSVKNPTLSECKKSVSSKISSSSESPAKKRRKEKHGSASPPALAGCEEEIRMDTDVTIQHEIVTRLSDFRTELGESDRSVLSRLRMISPAEFPREEINSDDFIHMDVFHYDSKNPFRKSMVQLPNFRLRVVSKDDPTPDVAFVVKLHQYFQDEVPIIYAVVYPDCIQFLQLGPVTLPTLF